MRILILFSLWTADKSENSQQWLKYYSHVLKNKFWEDSKFIAVNGCDKSIYLDYFGRIDNTLAISHVPDDKVINSDASGYQHALLQCKDLINKYDAVCFFHAKGISYDFAQMNISATSSRKVFLTAERLSMRCSNTPDQLLR